MMERESARSPRVPAFLAITAVALLTAATARAAEEPGDTGIVSDSEATIETSATATQTQTVMVEAVEPKFRLDIYGFAMIDTGYDFKQVNPDWFDVLRPTKLPAFDNEFGEDGNYYAGVRQSRLGVKGYIPTALGELKTIFEFEMFGTGGDAGQTTIRLRHAWGELGAFGAGQSWSPFMDPDVFPNSVEYWGPNGMAFFRNVQLRWMPMRGENEVWIALERPGASGDQGRFADRNELSGITGHFPAPDISARYRHTGDWGHFQIAGIARYISWDDNNNDDIDLSGNATGWGLNLSTNVKFGKTGVLRASVLYGEGIENYLNDAPVDIGIKTNFGNANRPLEGEALPILGVVAFYDFYWNDHFSSCFGYSMVDIDNSNGQSPSAFATGHYALANILYYPVKNVMAGFEFQWGRRENFRDGFEVDDYRIQFSARYNFSLSIGGNN